MEFHKIFKEPTGSQKGKKKERKKKKNKQKSENKVADLSANVLIITLNAYGPNTSIKW